MSSSAPSSSSLVKYETPVLVTGNKLKPVKPVAARIDKKGPLPSTEDILSTILPPRSWTQDGQLWTQSVSSTPATRIDVVNLQVWSVILEAFYFVTTGNLCLLALKCVGTT